MDSKGMREELLKASEFFTSHAEKKIKELEAKERDLEQREKRWNDLMKQVEDNIKLSNDLIHLNVGGTKFTVSKPVLLKSGNSYFAALLGGNWKPNSKGYFFVDRSPKHFNRILDYLRKGLLDTEDLSQVETDNLMEELDYYQIQIMEVTTKEEVLKWDENYCDIKVTFNEDRTLATSSGGLYRRVLATLPRTQFKVKIEAKGDIFIGFSQKWEQSVSYSEDVDNYFLRLLNANSGKLFSEDPPLRRIVYIDRPIAVGETVEAIFDKGKKEISYIINGINCGVAFKEVECKFDLFPLITVSDASVRILS